MDSGPALAGCPSPGAHEVIHHCRATGQHGKLFGSWETWRGPPTYGGGVTAEAYLCHGFGRIQFGSGVPGGDGWRGRWKGGGVGGRGTSRWQGWAG